MVLPFYGSWGKDSGLRGFPKNFSNEVITARRKYGNEYELPL